MNSPYLDCLLSKPTFKHLFFDSIILLILFIFKAKTHNLRLEITNKLNQIMVVKKTKVNNKHSKSQAIQSLSQKESSVVVPLVSLHLNKLNKF